MTGTFKSKDGYWITIKISKFITSPIINRNNVITCTKWIAKLPLVSVYSLMLTGYLITKPELGSDVNCSLKSICFSKLLSNLLKATVSLTFSMFIYPVAIRLWILVKVSKFFRSNLLPCDNKVWNKLRVITVCSLYILAPCSFKKSKLENLFYICIKNAT